MLKIFVPGSEEYDPVNNIFFYTKDTTLVLEHSLVSISKWESKWKIPFLSLDKGMTQDQLRDYVKCMTLTQNVDPNVYYAITAEQYKEIIAYMEDPMSATTIDEKQLRRRQKGGRRTGAVTSELVYYWMSALNLPSEYQKWHFNRLMKLIQVASLEQEEPQKMSKRDIYSQNRALNKARRAKHHTRG